MPNIRTLGCRKVSRCSLGADSFQNVLEDRSNWGTLTVPQVGDKKRTSVMTKNNRISLVQVSDIKKIQNNQLQVPLVAINSVSSIGSDQNVPQKFRAKASLNSISSGQSSQSSQTRSLRKSQLQSEQNKLNKTAAMRSAKISFMAGPNLAEFQESASSAGSSLFSEDDVLVDSTSEFMPPPLIFN